MNVTAEVEVSIPVPDLETGGLLGEFPEGQRLVGTRCDDCGCEMLDSRVVCSKCVSRNVHRFALPTTGVLYSFTRIHVGVDTPRPLGYVDLDGVEVRTLADISEDQIPLRPDMPVELRVEGDLWSFAPVENN